MGVHRGCCGRSPPCDPRPDLNCQARNPSTQDPEPRKRRASRRSITPHRDERRSTTPNHRPKQDHERSRLEPKAYRLI
jgi:hypothetical protein